jgi:sulfonate transport system permease protein
MQHFSKLKGFYIPLLLLATWMIGSGFGFWNPYIIPPPAKVLATAQQLVLSGELFEHAAVSLYRVFAGFTVAFSLAFPLGVLVGMNRRWVPYCEPILEFLRHIPPLATIPMLILWFGIDETSKLVIIVLATFFPIYLNTVNGIIHCNPKLLEVGRSFRFSRRQQFGRIILPAILPYVLIGMRLGLGYSWRSLIGAELIAAAAGIGYMILDAEQLSRPDIIVVGILTIGILGSMIDYAFFRLTRFATPWGDGKELHGWG